MFSSALDVETSPFDLQFVRGQEHVKRALEVAAAGGHAVSMTGSPGSGKTLLARALGTLLPSLATDASDEVAAIARVAKQLADDAPLPKQRPFVAPHPSTSRLGLTGTYHGGQWRPGILSLAHQGVLLLDELPAFGAKQALIVPAVANRLLTMSSATGAITASADVLLVATQRPCPCGWYGDEERTCSCSPALIARYHRQVDRALKAAIDIHITVPRVRYEQLASNRLGEPSGAVRTRVAVAWQRQAGRDAVASPWRVNATLSLAALRAHCQLDGAGQALMKAAMRQLSLSARGYHRVLKVARTIADLAAAAQIGPAHLAEAIQYRSQYDD